MTTSYSVKLDTLTSTLPCDTNFRSNIDPIVSHDSVTFFKTDDHNSLNQHLYFADVLDKALSKEPNTICYFEILMTSQADVDKYLTNPDVTFDDIFPEAQNGNFINYKPILEVCKKHGTKIVCYDTQVSIKNLDVQDKVMYDLINSRVNINMFKEILSKMDSDKTEEERWTELKKELAIYGCIDVSGKIVGYAYCAFSTSNFYPYYKEIQSILKAAVEAKSSKKIVLIGASHNIDITKVNACSSTIEMSEDFFPDTSVCKKIQGTYVPVPSFYISDSSNYFLLFPDVNCR